MLNPLEWVFHPHWSQNQKPFYLLFHNQKWHILYHICLDMQYQITLLKNIRTNWYIFLYCTKSTLQSNLYNWYQKHIYFIFLAILTRIYWHVETQQHWCIMEWCPVLIYVSCWNAQYSCKFFWLMNYFLYFEGCL